MNINIYQKYKVKKIINCSFIDNETSTPNDINFKDFNKEIEEEIEGSYLLDYITDLLTDKDIIGFAVKQNKIKIEHFNPFSGEGGDTYIEIEEV